MSRFTSLLLLSLVPLSLAGQESGSDSSPFHGGQWAMQFGGGANLFSLGVLKFTSPRGAWLLDLSTNASFFDAKSTDQVGTTTSADRQFIGVSARLGRRFYQAPGHRVVSFQTIALEGGLNDQMIDFAGGNVRQTTTNYGLNGELGGAYMLTGGVSVGGTASISAGRFTQKYHDPGNTLKGDGWYVDGIQVLFALAIYF
mgnify:CR=1 FL=1